MAAVLRQGLGERQDPDSPGLPTRLLHRLHAPAQRAHTVPPREGLPRSMVSVESVESRSPWSMAAAAMSRCLDLFFSAGPLAAPFLIVLPR